MRCACLSPALAAVLVFPAVAAAQGTLADYRRAADLRERMEGRTENVASSPEWIGATHRFWYDRTVRGGHEFVLVDAESSRKGPAFDHARLAAALGTARDTSYSATNLPFNAIEFVDNQQALCVQVADSMWRCVLSNYRCTNAGAAPHRGFGFGRGGGAGQNGQDRDFRPSPDGMGTANRSKAFHEVAWRNLGDAGFPDRILWHRAVAAKYPYYDIDRVGVYGGSAGGQNSLGALLFHGDFYKAAVSSVGCHDNRMDKIWWNELWMGWPLGPHYEASSNVVHANKLQGKLLLVVGEMDTNVDPASTMQVVNALIRADKYFDLLVIPGAGHGSGGDYGTRKRFDFFVRHLLGVEPPDWTGGVTLAEDGAPDADFDFDFDDDDPPPSFFDVPDPDHPPGGGFAWR